MVALEGAEGVATLVMSCHERSKPPAGEGKRNLRVGEDDARCPSVIKSRRAPRRARGSAVCAFAVGTRRSPFPEAVGISKRQLLWWLSVARSFA